MLQDILCNLKAGERYACERKYFRYVFEKADDYVSGDENNMVSVTVFDKNGAIVGTTGNCHLLDYYFVEDCLDMEFIEGNDWARNLIDDDFDHTRYKAFIAQRNAEDTEVRSIVKR